MSAGTRSYVRCDWRNPVPGVFPSSCMEEITHVTQAKARKEAAEAGWARVPCVLPSGRRFPSMDKDYCPDHKPEQARPDLAGELAASLRASDMRRGASRG